MLRGCWSRVISLRHKITQPSIILHSEACLTVAKVAHCKATLRFLRFEKVCKGGGMGTLIWMYSSFIENTVL